MRAARAGDSVRRYGAGTPGSGGIAPTLWATTTPRPGAAGFRLRIERALGGTWAFPFLATSPADFTLGGVRFLVDPSSARYGGAYFLSGSGPGGGSGEVPLPLPNNPELIGRPLFVQAFTLDDFAPNPLGLGATAGLRLTMALPGRILAARALAGAPDPQSAIDLAANQVADFDTARFGEGRAAAFALGGGTALVLDPTAARLREFDAAGWPPVWRRDWTLATEGVAEHLAATPDGSRIYVLHTGAGGTRPPITAYDARAGATFGQPWPGQPIRLDRVADARAMVFRSDSTTAFVAALGSATGTPGSVSAVDVQPGSPLFHQQLARIEFAGRQVTDVAVAPTGDVLYLPLTAPGQRGQLALVNVATFTPIDVDAGAPGVQHLGGEVSLPRTPLPDVLGRAVADPRGGEVYVAAVGAIVRVGVAPGTAAFRRVVATSDNIPALALVGALVASDAGDLLYAATPVQVIELDTRTLLSPRGWPIHGAAGLAFR